MKYKITTILLLLSLAIIQSCAYYSFTGKSIPPHVKTVQVLLFDDNTSRYDLSLPQEINTKLLYYIDDYRLMDIDDSKDADSKVYGTIQSFTESVASQSDDEVAQQRTLSLRLAINFYDNIKDEFIVKSYSVSHTENYDESGGETARDEAMVELLERIGENAVIALSSNW
ncbi:MAG: hypothetical protein PF638_08300 [Candidatus Delongbacteria bacterium]|jgi:hypothetical protein|nr:hypothetical protein [Candidatus Delongbacteria bacterium]